MNTFDIVILSIIGLSSLFGLFRGMIYIVINFLGVIASIVFALFIYPHVVKLFTGHIENEIILMVAGGVSSYIISLIIFTLACMKIVAMFSFFGGGSIDRVLGFVIGIIRGWLVSVVIYAGYAVFSTGSFNKAEKVEDVFLKIDEKKYSQMLKESSFSGSLKTTLEQIVGMVPESAFRYMDDFIPKSSGKDEVVYPKNEAEKKDTEGKEKPDEKSTVDTIKDSLDKVDKISKAVKAI